MLRLAKTEPSAAMTQRMIRMMHDTRALLGLTGAEVRAVYRELETMRDAISALLDKADGKHV